MFAVEISGKFNGQNLLHAGKVFNLKAVKDAEKAALDEAQAEALIALKKTVATWETPARFTARRSKGADGGSVNIFSSTQVWLWLDQGTRVRYATMTKGFQPKTRTGVLYSYVGSGGVATVQTRPGSWKMRHKGITARGWSGLVQERVAPIIRRAYQDGLHARWINP